MSLFSPLSTAEKKIIKKITVVSFIISLLIVGGVWLYYKITFDSKKKQKESLNFTAESINKILPLDLEAHKIVASNYLKNNAPEKAIPHLKRVYSILKNDLFVLSELAKASLEAGYYNEALEYYNKLLAKKDTLSKDECAKRGITLFYCGKKEESKEALIKCLEIFPNNAEAYCMLGQIETHYDLKSPKALEYFNRAIAIDSSYLEGWYQLARYYMEQKLYLKAREFLLKAIEIDPLHSKSHARLGMVYYYLDYPELAKKSYQTALALNPNDYNTYYNFAELLYNVLKDTVSALKNYKNALSLKPDMYEASFKIGLICIKNGLTKEAVRYFEEALKSAPNEIRILLQCAAGWEKLGNKEKALELYKKIISIDELNSIAKQKIKLLEGEM